MGRHTHLSSPKSVGDLRQADCDDRGGKISESKRDAIMKNLLAITVAIAVIGGTSTNSAGACNANLPTFELMGFPISPHQVAVMGSARVEESSVTPELTLAGMPASPHQIAVLTFRSKASKIVQATVGIPEPSTVGLAPRGLATHATGIGVCPAD
ncbi:hypothetical protein ACVWYH_008405 [Bradyrhizobium sp. GM24.11]|jgi:hypothetical protein